MSVQVIQTDILTCVMRCARKCFVPGMTPVHDCIHPFLSIRVYGQWWCSNIIKVDVHTGKTILPELCESANE